MLSTEEKLDLILKYQKSTRRWTMVRAIISFLFFIAFVVLPIISLFYLSDFIKQNVDIEEVKQAIGEIKSSASGMNEAVNNMPR